MPPHRFLFEKRLLKFGEQPSKEAVEVGKGYEIVPGQDARALVAYLMSLHSDAILFETPIFPKPELKKAASTNAPAATMTNSVSTNAPANEVNKNKRTAIRTMDEAEPKTGWSATPIAFVVLLALLAYWGMVYLSQHGGSFSGQVYAPFSSYDALVEAQPPTGPDQFRDGKKIFTASCAVCHQASGLGGNGFPPLAGSEWVLAPKPDRIIRIVLNGFQGPVEVKGQQFNNVMVPWRETLTHDESIAAVLTYVRNEWGNKAAPVTPEEVKAIRDATAKKEGSWTAPDLQPIPDR